MDTFTSIDANSTHWYAVFIWGMFGK